MSTPEENKSLKNKTHLTWLLLQFWDRLGVSLYLIIIAAVLGGMSLDARMGTKPWFTIGLVCASIPHFVGPHVFYRPQSDLQD
jgi:hypothetical protein